MRYMLAVLIAVFAWGARADASVALFTAAELSLAVDAMQTLQIRRMNDATARSLGCNPCHEINLQHEINPLLGAHPSDAAVLGYFGALMLGQAALRIWGPRWLSNSVSAVTLAVQIPMIAHNFGTGLQLRLPF